MSYFEIVIASHPPEDNKTWKPVAKIVRSDDVDEKQSKSKIIFIKECSEDKAGRCKRFDLTDRTIR